MDKKKISDWSNFFKFYVGKRLLKKAFMRLGLPIMKGRVLDVGSGRAPYSKEIKDGEVVTIDYDSKRGPMVIGSCVDLPFKSSHFDGVVCTEVLEHVSEPSEALSEIWRVMKPGGALYVTAPQLWCLHYEPYDFYRYTRFGLEHLLLKTGFRVDIIEPVGGFFTFVTMRFSETFYNILNKVFFFLPRGVRIFFIIPVVWPVSVVLGAVCGLLERPHRKDVLTWSVVARKESSILDYEQGR